MTGTTEAGWRALAAGDFDRLAAQFEHAGLPVTRPGAGMLQVGGAVSARRLLLSVGVHGNETAPIEMLAEVLNVLGNTPVALATDILLVVGNPAAIARGKRFLDADLNRMFCSDRGVLRDTAEAARADQIMAATTVFFRPGAAYQMHLDLHSAIRPSHYSRFAVVPAAATDPTDSTDATKAAMDGWLADAAIEGTIANNLPAPTYSAWTAGAFGAASCTVELGQVGTLGANPRDQLVRTGQALGRLLRGQEPDAGAIAPIRFRVAQEIVKRSEAFRLVLDRAAPNFTSFAPHAVIATDGADTLRAGPATEYVVFPNPDVLVGQRAGLMVVQA